MFLVIPIALFISEAVRATASLLLSYAGGDKACLVGTTHSYSAWAALQHGISAVFGHELKVSMKECLSGQLNVAITGFMLLVFMTIHPLL